MVLGKKTLCLIAGCVLGTTSATKQPVVVTDQIVQDAVQKYGEDARSRFTKWQELIADGQSESDWDRIHEVNQFFNRHIDYVSDDLHWGKNDYWATPVETLGTEKGDCEDYAIAKYFTLRAMGVADEKLRLMYVRALSVNQPHMVLIFFDKPDEYPYVLDNMDPQIKSAIERQDLRPIYSFNASGLWLAKANGLGNRVNDGRNNSNWTTVLEKIERGQ
jgi:predicted transglutaminase-like cysteine proteinase